jgi:2-haloacid dehalogenase
MVAAHASDLEAAKHAGLKTAFIARPDEYGPGLGESKQQLRLILKRQT